MGMSQLNHLSVLIMTEVTTKRLAILGASGHGKVVADLAEQCGYNVVFYDDSHPHKTTLEHWTIRGTFGDLLQQDASKTDVAVAIGNNVIRQQKTDALLAQGFNLPVLTHLTAVISQYAVLGQGSVVLAGAIVNAFACIGKGVIINSGAVVEHDCLLGHYAHVCPNAALSGGVKVGTGAWIGIGSQIKQLVVLGDYCLIGAGSTVVKDIPAHVTVYGSPARVVVSKL